MKKLIALMLSISLMLSVLMALTACGHTHEYSEDWSMDASEHWHICQADDCDERADVASHEWDEGRVAKPAGGGEDGTMEYTCTVCGQKRDEVIEYVPVWTVTQDEWDKAFTAPIPNISIDQEYSYARLVAAPGGKSALELGEVEMFTFGKWADGIEEYGFMMDDEIYSNTDELDSPDGRSLVEYAMHFSNAHDLVPMSKYEYDDATRTYYHFSLDEGDAIDAYVSVSFLDGDIISFVYAERYDEGDGETFLASAYTLYDRGTTVITPATESN